MFVNFNEGEPFCGCCGTAVGSVDWVKDQGRGITLVNSRGLEKIQNQIGFDSDSAEILELEIPGESSKYLILAHYPLELEDEDDDQPW